MIILGAGLAGLSAAYHGGGKIYEKELAIGGTCSSMVRDGFVFDLGIHVLHTKDRYVLKLLSKHKKPGLKLRRRSARIYSNQVLTKYPFQANTFGLPKNIASQCLIGFMEALGNTKRNYDNYEDWVYANFGKGIAEHFYLPYSEKFWTVKASELTNDWIDVRVPRPRLEQVIAGALSIQKEEFGPNALFQYPLTGGIQRVADALVKPGMEILLGKKAEMIKAEEKIVFFGDRMQIAYNNLISTLPLPELIGMIDKVPVQVKRAVNDLKYNSIFCVNLGIKREDLTLHHWIYFPEARYLPFRVSFPRNFSKFTVPKGWSSIQAEISYSKFKPIKQRDIVEKVICDLIKAKIIKAQDKVKLISTKDIKFGYIIYDHSRVSNLKIINQFLKKYRIYNAGRYARWEYLWMDETILSGRKVIKEIKAR